MALRDFADSKKAIQKAQDYTRSFNVEYKNLLTYVVSELISNTLEHGSRTFLREGRSLRFPSLVQFSWYAKRDELQFVVADLGVGVKQHLEKAYPRFATHAEALLHSIKPQVSGTFGPSNMYGARNNAGMGLYISSSILQRLHADMYLISGNGQLHISPTDITTTTIKSLWPGTIVHVRLALGSNPTVLFQSLMTELRENARREVLDGDKHRAAETLDVSIFNFFGKYAENKAAAIQYRDKFLLPAIEAGRSVVFDFADVELAPHSVLNALLASAVEKLGLAAYKRLRFLNVSSEIRETIDYILDANSPSVS
jgi:hypothetical protein